MNVPSRLISLSASVCLLVAIQAQAALMQVEVTVENLAPGPTVSGGVAATPQDGAIWIMRPWVGFHSGSYSTFALGTVASSGVEHEAEDGFIGDIANTTIPPDAATSYGAGARQFQLYPTQAGAGTVQGSFGGPLAPGLSVKRTFLVDSTDARNQYLSYMAMVIPSNDAFFGNADPKAVHVFDTNGNFLGPITISVHGSDILDAGTEVNSEIPADTAFYGQGVPDTGMPENGVVHLHPGFNHPATGGILRATTQFPPGGPVYNFQNADFKLAGYEIGRITVTAKVVKQIQVTVENLAPGPMLAAGATATPNNGAIWIMRPWIGFHDGAYSTYAVGSAASSGVEHEAEDGFIGDTANTTIPPDAATSYGAGARQFQLFPTQAGAGTVQGSFGGPLAPGLASRRTFIVDPSDTNSQYLSYMAMVIPSNDAFFGNADPKAVHVFDTNGNFLGPITISVHGSDILDAGTEVNSEIPADTAFYGQGVPDTGTPENGVVHVHPGFNHPATGGILRATTQFPPGGPVYNFQNADFKLAGYEIGRITVAEIPPSSSTEIEVTVENLAPGPTVSGGAAATPQDGAIWIMRPWVGFHSGSYSTFALGTVASSGVEHEAEDGFIGDTANTTIPPDAATSYGAGARQFQLFPTQAGAGTVQGSFGGPLAPGLSVKRTFLVDSTDAKNQYLSYMAMVIPSNDAFFGNADPKAVHVFDTNGNFLGPITISVHGSDILDAGTEVNSEIPADTAFYGQGVPDTGTPENGVVHLHPGFNHPATGGILRATTQFPPGGPVYNFQNADFKLAGYEIGRITVAAAAAPTLTIARNGDDVVISWPINRTLYSLEMANDLNGGSWSLVAGVANNSIAFKAPNQTRFYRLTRQ